MPTLIGVLPVRCCVNDILRIKSVILLISSGGIIPTGTRLLIPPEHSIHHPCRLPARVETTVLLLQVPSDSS